MTAKPRKETSFGNDNDNTENEFDSDEARRFLGILDPEATSFSFQTFTDAKDRSDGHLTRTLHGGFDELANDLIDLNRRGAAVNVTVNATDGKGRKKENIVRPRAVYADFDRGIPALPLEPSIRVETSPGKQHCYWLVDDLSFEDFERIEKSLVALGADPKCKDIARVMRLPGSIHRKGEPRPVKIIGGSEKRYTADELKIAFPMSEVRSVSPSKKPRKAKAKAERRVSEVEVDAALAKIPPVDYDDWLKTGMALHHWSGGSDLGLRKWRDWSSGCLEKYKAGECEALWDGFGQNQDEPVTVKTLLWLAKQHHAGSGLFDWPELTEKGLPKARSQPNIRYYLERRRVRLYYDEFKRKYFVDNGGGAQEVDERTLIDLFMEADAAGLQANKNYFYDALCRLAHEDTRNELIEYLDNLRWDGTPRIDSWLSDYAGADDNDYTRAVGRSFVLAAVKRARHPGVKYDHLVILEAPQGAGKSSTPKTLAGEDRFSDCLVLGAGPKEMIEQTTGKWIIEFSELSGIRKKDVENVKSMLSRTEDISRLAYGRVTVSEKRRFVLIGTTNDDRYLIDQTGNRRYLPVRVGKIDLERLARDRDQLWAEAAYLEAQGESIYMPEHVWPMAAKEQEKRRLGAPTEEVLTEIFEGRQGIVLAEDVYHRLGLERVSGRQSFQIQSIRKSMERLGWKYERRRLPRTSYGRPNPKDNRVHVFVREAGQSSPQLVSYNKDGQRFDFENDE